MSREVSFLRRDFIHINVTKFARGLSWRLFSLILDLCSSKDLEENNIIASLRGGVHIMMMMMKRKMQVVQDQ